MRWGLALGVASACIAISGAASADEPAESDVDTLRADVEQQLSALDEALGAADCEVACTALEAMQRSTENLCRLDDGERCASARSRVADAARRLREACPDCAAASDEVLGEVDEDPKEPTQVREEDDVDREVAAGAAPEPMSPPAESARGSCGACRVGGEGEPDLAWLAALAMAGALTVRRRRRR